MKWDFEDWVFLGLVNFVCDKNGKVDMDCKRDIVWLLDGWHTVFEIYTVNV